MFVECFTQKEMAQFAIIIANMAKLELNKNHICLFTWTSLCLQLKLSNLVIMTKEIKALWNPFCPKKLHSFWCFISQDIKFPFGKWIFASNVNKIKSRKHSSRNSQQIIALGLVSPEVNKSEQVNTTGWGGFPVQWGSISWRQGQWVGGSMSSEVSWLEDELQWIKGNGQMGFPPFPLGQNNWLMQGQEWKYYLPATSSAGGKYVIQ